MANSQSATLISHPLVDGSAPEWASGWGQDQFGVFADFTVVAENGDDVSQRMRWLPAGHFKIGSAVEPKNDNEQPQHDVTLSRPFWIFDTPCTQSLWEAVMRSNPSRFVDPERPVERVAWEDAVGFTAKLNSMVAGLSLRLPTEAEWEYACRASTVDATYHGPMEIVGENNAPILDEIAWYDGNSGHDFDLENGVDSTDRRDKQNPHAMAGTRKVALKTPNDWGLYDMLGNVWEGCRVCRDKPVWNRE